MTRTPGGRKTGNRNRRTTTSGHALNARSHRAKQDNPAIIAPAPRPALIWRVAQGLRGSAANIDSLQLAIGKKTEGAAVRRPESEAGRARFLVAAALGRSSIRRTQNVAPLFCRTSAMKASMLPSGQNGRSSLLTHPTLKVMTWRRSYRKVKAWQLFGRPTSHPAKTARVAASAAQAAHNQRRVPGLPGRRLFSRCVKV